MLLSLLAPPPPTRTFHRDLLRDVEQTLLLIGPAPRLPPQPIRVSNLHDAIFSFLDDRPFVVPSLPSPSERASEIILSVHQPCHRCARKPSPPRVRSYFLSVADVLADVRSLRFFPNVCARRRGVSRGPLLRGHVQARVRHPDRGDVPVGGEGDLSGTARPHSGAHGYGHDKRRWRRWWPWADYDYEPPSHHSFESLRYRRAIVFYEPFISRRLGYASRGAPLAADAGFARRQCFVAAFRRLLRQIVRV